METKQEPTQTPTVVSEKRTRHALGPSMRWFEGETVTLKLSPDAQKFLIKAMNLSNGDVDDIFRKALVMYTRALEARHDGKAVGTALTPDVLEDEFVGF